MRRVRYRVAASLDGYIAGPNGEIDWIVHDPAVDPRELFAGIDTVLLGRRTDEATQQPGAPPWPAGWRVFVFSKTLRPEEHRNVTIIAGDAPATVVALRAERGKDIWLFGGGGLFRSLLDAKLVYVVEIAVVPVLLGGGVPLVEPGAVRTRLNLVVHDVYPAGSLLYDTKCTPALAKAKAG
ncbi:MAG TPA: dihydrofolate reductase family protein [Thermoanaerobaculia bacterium]|jgi:dihydrofolate reductase